MSGFRTALLASGLLAVSALAMTAGAQNMIEPAPAAEDGQPPAVDFTDPTAPIQEGANLNLSVRDDTSARLAAPHARDGDRARRMELAIAAGGGDAPLDISIAQHASLGANREGEINRRGRGSELRVGRGLVGQRSEDGARNSTYVFVASDNEALTWQPGARSEFGGPGSSLALQDRVEVGDLSAGVTFEREGVQTSLAYVEREQSTRVGNHSVSQDQSFAGVTVTMRH